MARPENACRSLLAILNLAGNARVIIKNTINLSVNKDLPKGLKMQRSKADRDPG
jgi:hypothetical protein